MRKVKSRCLTVLAVASLLLVIAVPQTANAQLLAYEGFDYENGDLGIVSEGVLSGGTGWNPGTGVGLGWTEDPTFASGFASGQGNTSVVENPADWGYTDANGNALVTSGRAVQQNEWNRYRRNIDYSSMIPANDAGSLLRVGSGGIEGIGAGGAELWISFIGQGVDYNTSAGTTEGAANSLSNIGIVDNDDFESGRLQLELGRPWRLQQNGNGGPGNTTWAAKDHGITPKVSVPAPNEASVELSGDPEWGARYTDKVFFVTRIKFYDSGDPIPGDASNFFGDEIATTWIDPILGSTAPSEASAAVTDLIVGDMTAVGMWFNGNADTFYDEVRFGLSYADVAPIAVVAPGGGDFDNDGDVDGADFLAWQRDTNLGDLADWEANYGTPNITISAVSAVPEPSTLMLAGAMALAMVARRRRSA